MPFNGNGQYAAPASSWNPAISATTINSTDWAALLADLSTALSTCVLKDGTQTPTGNIPMGGFRLTGLGAATAVTDAPQVKQVQNSSFTSLTGMSGTNTVTGVATPTPGAYVIGQCFEGISAGTNTGATTLNISGLGAGAVQNAGSACIGGEFTINTPFRVIVSAVTPVFQIVANGPRILPANITNSLSGDVTLNNTGTFFDGPSIAQGTTGTWWASGIVTLVDTAGSAGFVAKLWDGTTVIASGGTTSPAAYSIVSISLSGYITSPAANIKISVEDFSSTNGAIKFNASGASKDSTLSAIRIK